MNKTISIKFNIELERVLSYYLLNTEKEVFLDFTNTLENVLDYILKNPELSVSVNRFKNIRRRNLTKFPYKIYYKVTKNTIIFLRIRHHSRENIKL